MGCNRQIPRAFAYGRAAVGQGGMPAIRREGLFTVADPAELQAWLGREAPI
jgi:hypothetical protein